MTIAREEMRRALGEIQDVERLLSKITLETANSRNEMPPSYGMPKPQCSSGFSP